jgi:predicted DNA-binding transcriptional regulator YafY
MPRGNQLTRQWQLLQLIDRPVGITVDDAAQDLDCTVRTIWRDLSVLQDAGFPIYNDPGADGRRSVWRVREEFKRALPLKLTLAELAALVMSRELLAPLGASVLGPAVTAAHDKITAVLSRDARALLDQMRQTVGVRLVGAKLQAPAADYMSKLQTALSERRQARIRYYSYSTDRETERTVEPYHVTYFNGGLYLVGYCHLRKDLRIFAVERMRALDVLRTRFMPPADFDAARYLNNALGILRGDLVMVRVAFFPSVARYIRERLWHPSQQFRDLSDGRLEVVLNVADTLEVRRWILGYGVQAEILEPASLREALRVEALAVAERLTPRRRPLASVVTAAERGARSVVRRNGRRTANAE